jgi:hypothetical protein
MQRHAVTDVAAQGDSSRRLGRPARPEPAEATGYRVTAALRREIDVPRGFTGVKSAQAFIDEAVRAHLHHLRETMPNFRIAAEPLDAELRRNQANVTTLDASRRTKNSTSSA